MRWLLFALVGLVALAGCIGADDPTGDEVQPTEIDPQTPDRPDEGPPTHPDPDGNGSLENASEGGFSMTHVPPGDYETNLSGPSQVLEEGPYEVAEERVVEIESPLDGATIQIGVVLPHVPEGTKVPVIGVATPYFRGDHLDDIDLSEHDRLSRFVENHLPHGYAVAAIPVRGTSGNGGCMTLGGPSETADLDHAITWLGEADFSNGNVALTGISYDGWAAWEAAATGNPHLETIVPIQGFTDFHEFFHPNGTSRIHGAGYFHALFWGVIGNVQNDGSLRERADKISQNLLCPEAYHGFAATGYSTATGERDPTGYWAERSAREGALANYTGSAFVLHGLKDWNVRPSNVEPWVRELVDEGIPVKRWYGQWGHENPDYTPTFDAVNPNARWDFAQTLHNWFAYWLKEDTTRDLGPPIQVQSEDGSWRSAWTWPGTNATWRTYNLTPSGSLSEEGTDETAQQPLGPDPGRTGPYNERGQAVCPTCPTFTSDPLDDPTIVSGRPRVHVTVTPTSPAPGHLSAFLYVNESDDGTPEGRPVGWGTIDLRFADGDDEAQPVVPGEPLRVRLSLEPMDATVEEGDRLELVLSQGAREADERDLGYGVESADVSPTPPTGMLLHTGDGQSTLSFEQPQPPADRFFAPPGG